MKAKLSNLKKVEIMVAIEPETQSTSRNSQAIYRQRFALSPADQRFPVIALGTLFALYLLAIVRNSIVDASDAHYAEITCKMVEHADWITAQFNFSVAFWVEPPRHAIDTKPFGRDVFGVQFFMFASSLGIPSLGRC